MNRNNSELKTFVEWKRRVFIHTYDLDVIDDETSWGALRLPAYLELLEVLLLACVAAEGCVVDVESSAGDARFAFAVTSVFLAFVLSVRLYASSFPVCASSVPSELSHFRLLVSNVLPFVLFQLGLVQAPAPVRLDSLHDLVNAANLGLVFFRVLQLRVDDQGAFLADERDVHVCLYGPPRIAEGEVAQRHVQAQSGMDRPDVGHYGSEEHGKPPEVHSPSPPFQVELKNLALSEYQP